MSTEKDFLGKFSRDQFEKFIKPHLRSAPELIIPPKFGSDYAALEIGKEKVLTLSTDPLSISKQLGWKRSGKLALQVVACDVAASGIPPRYISTNWNLPVSLSDETFDKVCKSFCREARREGITIIGGHTGRYEGPGLPITGAATVFGIGEKSDLLNGEIKAGNSLALFGVPGLEAAGILSFYSPEIATKALGNKGFYSLRERYDRIRPTKTLNVLSSIPGILKLHDLGEGGLIGGTQELLEASEPGIRLERDTIKVPAEVKKVCRELELDPLKITSTGAGLAVIKEGCSEKTIDHARGEKIKLTEIGNFTQKAGLEIKSNGKTESLKKAVRDKFWDRLHNLTS